MSIRCLWLYGGFALVVVALPFVANIFVVHRGLQLCVGMHSGAYYLTWSSTSIGHPPSSGVYCERPFFQSYFLYPHIEQHGCFIPSWLLVLLMAGATFLLMLAARRVALSSCH